MYALQRLSAYGEKNVEQDKTSLANPLSIELCMPHSPNVTITIANSAEALAEEL